MFKKKKDQSKSDGDRKNELANMVSHSSMQYITCSLFA
jgi:hypothetical protein